MKYLVIKSKTKDNDGEFVGVIEATNIMTANAFIKKFSKEKHFAQPATNVEINWLQNDARARRDGKNTLPKNFNIELANKLN